MTNLDEFKAPTLAEVRLVIEGALALYEDEAMPLFHLATDAGELEAQRAFNAIGAGLYMLRCMVRNMEQ